MRKAAGRTRFGLTRSTGWSSDNKTPRPSSSQQLQFRLRFHIETPQLIFTQTRLGHQQEHNIVCLAVCADSAPGPGGQTVWEEIDSVSVTG